MNHNKTKYLILAVSGILLDRLSKEIVRHLIPMYATIPVIDGFLRITHIFNTGIAFGMAQGNNVILTILSTIILAALIWLFFKSGNKADLLPLSLIISGAAGNILDRLFYGSVRDFIEVNLGFPPFNPWPIFNIADSLITIGGILLFWREFLGGKKA